MTTTVTRPPRAQRKSPSTRPARRSAEASLDRAGPRVAHISAEFWPLASSGGLGQAVADLAGYQARAGARPFVILPLYRRVREALGTLRPVGGPLPVHQDGAMMEARCYETEPAGDDRPHLLLIDAPGFDRAGLYGEHGSDYADNATRFGGFAAATLELLRSLDPDIVLHVHDWHAALVPIYMHAGRAGHQPFRRLPVVLSVHNGGFQGVFAPETLAALGLPPHLWSPGGMEWYGRLNLLKGALKYADMVTTVSPHHAAEICSEVGGFGLHDVFQGLGRRLVGIRNGIDAERWNPRSDPEIICHFNGRDPEGKRTCKAALQTRFDLDVRADVPLFAMSARLAQQKGVDLIIQSRCVRESTAQFVLVGDGDPGYAASLRDLARDHPSRIAVSNFSNRLEHVVLAGADFLLMPSLYEPCGLTQMRAQRYGALPVVRRVGGLVDTVDESVGFLFDEFSPAALDAALEEAVAVFHDQDELQRRVKKAMKTDFSWDGPLADYQKIYAGAKAGAGAS